MNQNESKFSTSAEAYAYCLENGIISQSVAEVLKAICDGGSMNQTMCHQAIIRSTGKVGLEKYSVSPRFAVLERMGLIREVGKYPCPVTNRTTVFYDATMTKPVMSEGDALKNADKRELMKTLKDRNTELEAEVKQLRELLNIRSASFAAREARILAAPVAIQQDLF